MELRKDVLLYLFLILFTL